MASLAGVMSALGKIGGGALQAAPGLMSAARQAGVPGLGMRRTYAERVQQAMVTAGGAPPALQRKVYTAMLGHRRRGLSSREISGFYRVCNMLGKMGMKPSIRRHKGGKR